MFKTLALGQLFYHYIFPTTVSFEFDPISVGMIMTGYVVSMMATNAIGIDRTYFAGIRFINNNTKLYFLIYIFKYYS